MLLEDDDGSDEENLLRQDETQIRKPKEDWNIFETLPPEKDNDLDEDRVIYGFILRIFKFITYIVTFVLVLGASVVSKATTVLMTSQLRNHSQPLPYCYSVYGSNMEFQSFSTPEERISWVWAIYFVFMVPEAQTFLRGLRVLVLKGRDKPNLIQFFIPFIFETLHTIGLGLLLYTVFPNMDAMKAVMLTNAVCIVPGILGMLSRGYEPQWILKLVIDALAVIFQITALVVWPFLEPYKNEKHPWLLPLSAILISFGWWENFVDITSPFEIIRKIGKMKPTLRRTRYWTYTVISLWKMVVFLAILVIGTKINENSWSIAFNQFDEGFDEHYITVNEKRPTIQDQASQPATNTSYLEPGSFLVFNVKTAVLWTMGIQMASAYICYIIGKYTCRILIQLCSYSFPVLISVPVTLSVIVGLCALRSDDVCFWDSIFPGYLWWSCPSGDFKDYFGTKHTWLWILWIFSQAWITQHIWYPKGIRLAPTESIFTTPMYNAFLVDQTLALNRRRDEDYLERDEDEEEDTGNMIEVDIEGKKYRMQGVSDPSPIRPEDRVPKLYICATMWHEDKDEMMKILKSIFRMDWDQCTRRIARMHFEYNDPGYYEFESHIFFDDAFELSDKTDGFSPVKLNQYVRDFVSQIPKAAEAVHQVKNLKLRRPKKIPTPYGGRLEWILPGRTKLICHIKDKNKIRHKKRWSQVMYMYYLLGYKLTHRSDLVTERKEVIADNTFLLALDGDIDFQPSAVELLVDLMKKNPNLGAACGRIHPTGNGPMVWYQKFEYAVGHWFQKATEHVFGCVLCSPGCFSLFRGKALMDFDVMKKYTTMATEAIHCVQYDQGEDRWLCTLLLQRGWRVEYSAASDANTHAPEGFREFYNQRRRWVPSTMANIMDLLLDGKRTVKQNPDISYPYIIYQIFLLVGTILGPGTIFLMLVGAFAVAFKLDQWTSFLYNFIPILAFILVCFLCKAEIQLAVAEILTTIYALAMVAVVVAIILQISDDGIYAPSSLFLMIIASSFFIAGLIHPLEFWCLPHGFLYYITIPSMYLLLMIYSLFNLNVVSWGTREGLKTKTKQELEADKKEEEEMAKEAEKKRKKGLLGGLIPGWGGGQKGKDGKEVEGSMEFSCAGLFRLMCCVREKTDEQKMELARIGLTLEEVSKQIKYIERSVDRQMGMTRRLSLAGSGGSGGILDVVLEEAAGLDDPLLGGGGRGLLGGGGGGDDQTDSEEALKNKDKHRRDDLMNPHWMEDNDIDHCEVDFLTGPEIRFWNKMMKEYLLPLDADKKKEKEMEGKLIDLRNKVAFTFLMCNAVFVILIFLLQLEKDSVHFNWPYGANVNVTYIPGSDQVSLNIEYLELEPIGLVFVGVFGLVLGIQFIGMCIHRMGTFSHIMALTTIESFNKSTTSIENQEKDIKQGIGLIRKLQKSRQAAAKKEESKGRKSMHPGRRKTITNLERMKNQDRPVHDLTRQFSINFQNLQTDPEMRRGSKLFQSETARKTLEAMRERRSTVLGRRRSSVAAEHRKSQILEDSLNRSGSFAATPAQGPSARRIFDRKNSLRFAIKGNNTNGENSGGEEFEMDEQ